MQPYARAHLHLLRGLGRTVDAELFGFSTELTRLTPTLTMSDPVAAVERATAMVDDRFGGTRIASSLGRLLSHPTWAATVRGAVVVVVSDGWDADDPRALERRVRRLHRMAARLVWVNPRLAAPEFSPSTGGMAAALPWCDHLVSGHALSALPELVQAIVDTRSRIPLGRS